LCFLSFFAMRASGRLNSILGMINCFRCPYLLDVTPCVWIIGYRRFGINFHTHLHGAICSLTIRTLDMRLLFCFETSNTDYQVTRRRKAQ
jgi:hypothetical protein